MLDKIRDKIKAIPLGVRSAIVFMFATIFTRGLAIITTPIFTRIMTSEQIGEVNLFSSWYSMISVIATLSLTSGGFPIALKEFKDDRDKYVSSVLSLTSLISIIIAAIYFIAPSFWNEITGLPTGLMILMLIGFLVAPARDFWLNRQRYEYKYKLPGLVTILSALVASALSIVVVLYLNRLGFDKVAEGRIYANYIIVFSVAAIIWAYTLWKGKILYNAVYWKFSLKLSIPLVGYSVASQILNVSDRIMISSMVGNSEVGIYSTLYTVSSLSLMVWSALNSSFTPYMYQNIENRNHKIKEISFAMISLYGVLAILLVFCAPEIVKILATAEYYEAIYIMPPIAAGVYLTAISNLYSNVLVYLKDTKYIMLSSIIAAGTNIILNALAIPVFGYMAAAYTTMISYIIMALLLVHWAKKEYVKNIGSLDMVYDNKKNILISVLVILITLSGLLFYRNIVLRYICILCMTIIGIILLRRYKSSKKTD